MKVSIVAQVLSQNISGVMRGIIKQVKLIGYNLKLSDDHQFDIFEINFFKPNNLLNKYSTRSLGYSSLLPVFRQTVC